MLGAVSNKRDVMPPHIFKAGLSVNTDEYLVVMENVVKPWKAEGRLCVAAGCGARPYQHQDLAVVHRQPLLLLREEGMASQLT